MDGINSGVKWRREALPLPGTAERCCSKYPIPSQVHTYVSGGLANWRNEGQSIFPEHLWCTRLCVYHLLQFSPRHPNKTNVAVVQSLSCVQLFVTHGLQHARLPCPSLSPRVCSDSCALSPWCYPTITPCAAFFFFSLQSFPAAGSFPVSQLFTSGGQVILMWGTRWNWLQRKLLRAVCKDSSTPSWQGRVVGNDGTSWRVLLWRGPCWGSKVLLSGRKRKYPSLLCSQARMDDSKLKMYLMALQPGKNNRNQIYLPTQNNWKSRQNMRNNGFQEAGQ